MTEKELKKLNRYQLLELLLAQTERANDLEARLEEAQAKLDEQDVQLSNLGSIAEASLQLRGVFTAAQDAADMYIAAAKRLAAEMEAEARKKSAELLSQAMAEAKRIKGE